MTLTIPARLDAARDLLLQHFGYSDFRPAQRRVVQAVLAGHDTLAVLPTGGGKSICFQIPALILGNLTIVVSPLISLMQDQVEALRRRLIPAAHLNSTLEPAAAQAVMQQIVSGELRLVYVSPERLGSLAGELRRAGIKPALLAVDEAHCISEWGHDFRPAYREIAKARYFLGNPQIVALTGSATPEVREDITASLRLRAGRLVLGSFDRANLWFGACPVPDEHRRLATLLSLIQGRSGMAIVYAPTRGQTELLTQVLREHGCRASPYHGGLASVVRERVLHAFLDDRLEVVVATSAFGMGIDKPTVRLVVHWSIPPTMESYYQEAGRAGRDGELGRCIVLHNPADAALARRQLATTFPPRKVVEKAWRDPASLIGLPSSVRESVERLRRELRPEDGPVDWGRVKRREAKAKLRLDTMQHYATSRRCRRRLLLEYFGEKCPACSGCDRCSR